MSSVNYSYSKIINILGSKFDPEYRLLSLFVSISKNLFSPSYQVELNNGAGTFKSAGFGIRTLDGSKINLAELLLKIKYFLLRKSAGVS